jgi:hypothetical protein
MTGVVQSEAGRRKWGIAGGVRLAKLKITSNKRCGIKFGYTIMIITKTIYLIAWRFFCELIDVWLVVGE